MTCQEAEPLVSVLYDGEPVPPACAEHIASCDSCRRKLREYSEMGAELRLTASRAPQPAGIPAELRARLRPSRFSFLNARILVPRFAMALLVLALVTLSTSFVILRAQSPKQKLWFQFALFPQGAEDHLHYDLAAQNGYDDGSILWGFENGVDRIVGTHVTVNSIEEDGVDLALQSRLLGRDPATWKVKEQLTAQRRYHYTPGQTLVIPVEGGGTMQLRGIVVDHQPKLAWHQPVEPAPNQLVLNHPIVLSGDKVLANMEGGGALEERPGVGICTSAPALGRLTVALQPFPGSIPAQANWGELKFEANGQKYTLFSASPITGGEQPHAVWVALEPNFSATTWSIGSCPVVK